MIAAFALGIKAVVKFYSIFNENSEDFYIHECRRSLKLQFNRFILDLVIIVDSLILRNLTFHPGGRAKLLLLPNYMSLLNQCLKSGPSPSRRLALVSLWSLAANCHKAKVELARHGIMKTIEEIANEDACDDLASTVSTIVKKLH